MKIQIKDIYNDGESLIRDNVYIAGDSRLTDIESMSNDIELLIEEFYGDREIFKKYLKYDESEIYAYEIGRLKRATYALILEHLTEYMILLSSDDLIREYDPLKQFKTTRKYGEKSETITDGERTDKNVNGDRTTTTVVGSSTDSTQNGQRVATEAATSFSSSTFNDTNKSTTNVVTDSTTYGEHTDTTTLSAEDDIKTKGAQTNTREYTDHTDEEYGYTSGLSEIEKQRSIRVDTAKKIANDIVNAISYALYL